MDIMYTGDTFIYTYSSVPNSIENNKKVKRKNHVISFLKDALSILKLKLYKFTHIKQYIVHDAPQGNS